MTTAFRIRAHFRARPNVQGFVRTGGAWTRIVRADDESVLLEGGALLRYDDVARFVVAYPSGEIVDAENAHVPPAGTFFMPDAPAEEHVLRSAELAEGTRLVRVEHGPSPTHPTDVHYHATSLTNVGDDDVRILRFAGYAPRFFRKWTINTASGGFYTAQQFRDWYNAPEWLAPGTAVADPTNYGGRGSLWAYEIKTRGGKRCFAGCVRR